MSEDSQGHSSSDERKKVRKYLYHMEGSVVVDGAEMVTTAQEEQLVYKLLHYRIGHVSDRGLMELSKNGLILALQGE